MKLAAEEINAESGILATTDPAAVAPALKAGRPVAWVIPPARIAPRGAGEYEIEFKTLILSPRHTVPIQALADLSKIFERLAEPLGIEFARPDSVQFSGGPYWPSLEITYQLVIRKD